MTAFPKHLPEDTELAQAMQTYPVIRHCIEQGLSMEQTICSLATAHACLRSQVAQSLRDYASTITDLSYACDFTPSIITVANTTDTKVMTGDTVPTRPEFIKDPDNDADYVNDCKPYIRTLPIPDDVPVAFIVISDECTYFVLSTVSLGRRVRRLDFGINHIANIVAKGIDVLPVAHVRESLLMIGDCFTEDCLVASGNVVRDSVCMMIRKCLTRIYTEYVHDG